MKEQPADKAELFGLRQRKVPKEDPKQMTRRLKDVKGLMQERVEQNKAAHDHIDKADDLIGSISKAMSNMGNSIRTAGSKVGHLKDQQRNDAIKIHASALLFVLVCAFIIYKRNANIITKTVFLLLILVIVMSYVKFFRWWNGL